jgi:hypothetical protein
MNNQAAQSFLPSWQKFLQYTLIFFSSVLVCIWAMQHTIALRNGLLALGTIAGAAYFYLFFKSSKDRISFKNFIPLTMLGLVFVWVLIHYFFLVEDSVVQYQELRSTWLRCLLATIMGFATGLAISKKPSLMQCLWLGLFVATVAVYMQYIPRAWHAKNLFQPDYFNYIFYGKHNFVMVGTVLIAGIVGGMGDQLGRRLSPPVSHQTSELRQSKQLQKMLKAIGYLLFFIGQLCAIAAVLFAFVFMFDTRNGIGLAVILLLIAVAFVFLPILIGRSVTVSNSGNQIKNRWIGKTASLVLLLTITFLTTYFVGRQMQVNQGWVNAIEDTKIAVQIDRYPHWQNPSIMGYPKTDSGRQVTINNYERVAWATAAARMMIDQPLGNGVLHYSFRRALEKYYPNIFANPNFASASHSAWLELGLTLGLPGLLLLIGALLFLLKQFWGGSTPFSKTGFMLVSALLLLYIVAELIGQHGLESLFFWIALLSGLLFWSEGSDQHEG